MEMGYKIVEWLGLGDGYTSLAGRMDHYLISVYSVSLGNRKCTSYCFHYSRHTLFELNETHYVFVF